MLCVYRQCCSLYSSSLLVLQKEIGCQYRFSVVVQELRTADTSEYQASIAALINCIVSTPESIKERITLRNEFVGR